MSTTLNMFDLIFIASTVIILLLAFFRGFVREIFSLINWIAAITLVHFLSPYVAKIIAKYSGNLVVANIISSSVLFILVFIVSTLVTRKFAHALKEKLPMTLDQTLGVVYGFLKTLLIFGFVYSATIYMHSSIFGGSASAKGSMPYWLYDSKFRSVIEPFGKALNPIARSLLSESEERYVKPSSKKIKEQKNEIRKGSKKAIEGAIEEKYSPLQIFNTSRKNIEKTKPARKPIKIYEEKVKKVDENYKETGYSKKQINKMDRLIEIVE